MTQGQPLNWTQQVAQSFMINGVDCSTAIVSCDITQIYQTAIATGQMVASIKRMNRLTSLSNASTVDIYRKYTYLGSNIPIHVFSGSVKTAVQNQGQWQITLEDKLSALNKAYINATYGTATVGMKISDVLISIITAAGLNADNTSIPDSGALMVYGFLCQQRQAFEACSTLCASVQWQLYYDPRTNKVYAGPLGNGGSSGVTFQTSLNISGTCQWTQDKSYLFNDITVVTAPVTQTYAQSYLISSTGQQNLPVTYPVENVMSVVWDNNTLVQRSSPTDTTGDYYVTTSTNPTTLIESSTLIIVTNHCNGFGVPQAGESYYLTYTSQQAYAVRVTDATSIALYGDRPTFVQRTDLQTPTDAGNAANAYLAVEKNPIQQVACSACQGPIWLAWIGSTANVIDDQTQQTMNNMVVVQCVLHYPKKYDDYQLGQLLPLTADYLRGLETAVKALAATNNPIPTQSTIYNSVSPSDSATLSDALIPTSVTPSQAAKCGTAMVGFAEAQ